ncbi:MAG: hypothetical protein KF764_26285 [Labilithrix sp.]|nr:hypothetical protein [Labilithrix sp.]MBX3221604.1 hypothetical protein [Labilithrix sp.]
MTRPPGGGSRGRAILFALLGAACVCSLGACKKKISQPQCDQLLDHFAELVVKERYADAGPEAIAAERARERQEAKNADEFKNCTTAVQANEHECAMKAESSDALIKCLE